MEGRVHVVSLEPNRVLASNLYWNPDSYIFPLLLFSVNRQCHNYQKKPVDEDATETRMGHDRSNDLSTQPHSVLKSRTRRPSPSGPHEGLLSDEWGSTDSWTVDTKDLRLVHADYLGPRSLTGTTDTDYVKQGELTLKGYP